MKGPKPMSGATMMAATRSKSVLWIAAIMVDVFSAFVQHPIPRF
jgi:hypothetical protein